MKLIKYLMIVALFSNLFIACSSTDNDDELQLVIDQHGTFATDTGEDPLPPTPPTRPK